LQIVDLVSAVADRDLTDRSIEALVVRVLDDLPDVHVVGLEMQGVVCTSVGREPVLTVDLLTIGSEPGEKVLVALVRLGDRLTVGLHDLEVAVIDPDPAIKIAVAALHFFLFWRYIKDVGPKLVDLLLANIFN